MEEVTQPNEKSNELEQHRQKSLNDFVKEKKFGKDPDKEESEEKSEKKLDKEEKNSYINNDEDSEKDEQSTDKKEQTDKESEESESPDEYEQILEETFGGDPKKAVKSWKESQKSFGKLRKEKKQKEQQLQYLNNLVEENPMLGDIIKTAAEKGEISEQDLQNFLSEGNQEPDGKPKQSSSEGKLEVVDDEFSVDDVDTKTLAESGYIDPDKKDSMSPSEWRILKRQAAVKYAEDKLPQRLASKAYQQFQSQIDEAQKQKKQKERQKQNRQKNAERYEQGLERVVDEFNLDFAGNEQHEQLLDEIESVAVNIRDPQNNDVIHPNAIYLATVQVMEDKDMQLQKSKDVDKEVEKAKQDADESFDKRTGFNANTKKKSDDKPESLADKMSQQHFQQYQKEQEKRKRTGRISSEE